MFKALNIKMKITLLTTIASLLLTFSLAFAIIYKLYDIQITDKFNQLKSLNISEKNAVESSLKSVKSLIVSLSSSSLAQKSLLEFNAAFPKLSAEINISKKDIQNDLLSEYEGNYLSSVNYDIPAGTQRKDLIYYLPHSTNAQIAQYIFIAHNRFKVGQKNSLIFNPKYDNSYMRVHKKYHQSFDRRLKLFKFYDIFLINLKGDIVYTDFKEKDFATNLTNGVYKDTNLARAYHKALKLKKGEIVFSDFAPYEPSYNLPASFVAAPIYKDNKVIGVLAFQISVKNINNIVSFGGLYEDVGLGKSGESYIVGKDYKMRTDSRFVNSIKNPLVHRLHTTIGLVRVKTPLLEDVFTKGKTFSKGIVKSYNGSEVLSVVHILNVYDQTKWAIVTEIKKSEVVQPIKNLIYELLFLALIIFMFFIVLYLMAIKKIVIEPLDKLHDALLHFFNFINKKEKDVSLLTFQNDDEISRLANTLNENILKTKKLFLLENEKKFVEEGVAQLNSELIRLKSVEEIFDFYLTFLCKYIHADVGVIYRYDEKAKKLIKASGYSLSKKDRLHEYYTLGEGVIGEVGENKHSRHLNISEYEPALHVQTATLQIPAKNIYISALVFQNELLAVLEVGTLNTFESKELNLIEQSAKVVAISLASALKNNEVARLLEVSQKINDNLEKEQEKLSTANAVLEQQQQELEEANASLQSQKLELDERYKELKKAKKELQKSSTYKSEFLANMSHELRTPLNSIILLSRLLSQNKNIDDADKQKASVINKAGEELLLLINDILDLSKIESGKMELVNEKIHSKEVAQDMQNLFDVVAEQKGLKFSVVDNYQDVFISDKLKLEQVIKNLLSNAIKFTKEGSVEFRIESDGKNLIFEVSDTGIGIAKDKQESIFDSFKQVDGSICREFGGTGLGLAISKTIIQLMRGEIQVHSEYNKGTTFKAIIPLKKETTNTPFLQIEENEELHVHNLLEGKNILVADDDSRNIFSLTAILEDMQAKVFTALNGNEVLEILGQNKTKIDIILIDLMMPIMDGLSCVREIRKNPRYNDILIVVMSAKNMQTQMQEILEAGANEFLVKPININVLTSILSARV